MPTDDFVQSIDIQKLLPHQKPFIMVDRLEHFSMNHVVSSFEILPNNPFVENDKLSAFCLVENIAQTCAARLGYINGIMQNHEIQIGYVGAIKNFVVTSLPSVGERIFTEIEVLEEAFGFLLAAAKITSGDKTFVTSEIKIALQDSNRM